MKVAELIAILQRQDPAAVVVLARNVDYEAVAVQVRELTPVKLRAFAADSCAWFEFWDEAEVPQDERTVVLFEPVHGLLLE